MWENISCRERYWKPHEQVTTAPPSLCHHQRLMPRVPLDTSYQSGQLSHHLKAPPPPLPQLPLPWVHGFLINPGGWAVPLIYPRGTFPGLSGQEGPIITQSPDVSGGPINELWQPEPGAPEGPGASSKQSPDN